MTRKRAFVFVAVVALSLSAAARAQQSRPYGDEVYQAPQMASVNNPYSDYPAAEVQAIPAAKARAAIAKMELLRAQAELNRGTRAAIRTFEKSDDVTKATAEHAQAYQQYQAARERALRPLHDDEQYRAAQVMKQQIGQRIVEKHESTGGSAVVAVAGDAEAHKPVLHEIIALSAIKLRYASAATQKESEALRNSAEVSDARARLASANRSVSSLRERFADDLRDDPDLIAARRAVFDQKVAHVASQAYLGGLKEARGIALDYAYFVRRYNPYRVMGYDPYGFNRYYSYGYR